MRSRKKDLKPQCISLNMTPMIDIVFLLIIFFLVSSNLIQQDVSMELDLPGATTGGAVDATDTKKITINIPRAGSVLLGSQPVQRDQLREHFLGLAKNRKEEMELRIRTNKDVPFGEVEPLLVLAAQCGFQDVSFAVVEKIVE